MYQADLNHPDKTLQAKLKQLYALGRGTALDLSFRPPFMQLLERFGNPHLDLPPIIHVAGTNGKGSTIAIMRAILEAGGYKVHVYTSPHLLSFNERIVLAGKEISNKELESLIDEAIHLNNDGAVTFFEITTAMAFAAFNREPADVLLLEVGLGGRLDCTNIIPKPSVSIISAISYDHTQFLGENLEDIAREKSGIIKENVPCVVAPQPDLKDKKTLKVAVDIIVDVAGDKNSPLYRAGHEWCIEPSRTTTPPMINFRFGEHQITLSEPNLLGIHQIGNAGTALAALHLMKDILPLTHANMEDGLRNVRWPGRLEKIELPQYENAELWYDGGHNDSAGLALGQQADRWNKDDNMDLHIILGMKADKDPQAFLQPLLPYTCSLSVINVNDIGPCVTAAQIEPIMSQYSNTQFLGQQADLKSAVETIGKANEGKVRILVCGSLYLAEKIEALKSYLPK